MTTTVQTDVDGSAATVHLDAKRDEQLPLLSADPCELAGLLDRKYSELEAQTAVVDREKKKLKVLEAECDDIVAQIRRVGHGETPLPLREPGERVERNVTPAAGETYDQEPMPAGGTTRIALPTTAAIDPMERIPQESAPEFCVCGALMDSADEGHALSHRQYLDDRAADAAADEKRRAERLIGSDAAPQTACSSCGRPIAFALTPNLKRVPLDFEPVEDGEYVTAGRVLAEGGKETVVQLARAKAEGETAERYTSHFRTCPFAKQHSRRNGERK